MQRTAAESAPGIDYIERLLAQHTDAELARMGFDLPKIAHELPNLWAKWRPAADQVTA
jgi:hypothetical protein